MELPTMELPTMERAHNINYALHSVPDPENPLEGARFDPEAEIPGLVDMPPIAVGFMPIVTTVYEESKPTDTTKGTALYVIKNLFSWRFSKIRY